MFFGMGVLLILLSYGVRHAMICSDDLRSQKVRFTAPNASQVSGFALGDLHTAKVRRGNVQRLHHEVIEILDVVRREHRKGWKT